MGVLPWQRCGTQEGSWTVWHGYKLHIATYCPIQLKGDVPSTFLIVDSEPGRFPGKLHPAKYFGDYSSPMEKNLGEARKLHRTLTLPETVSVELAAGRTDMQGQKCSLTFQAG